MPTCDDYQLSFEMQLHGAAPAIPVEEITAHIASCASCTAYVATTQETAMMSTTNWIDHSGFDSARLLERVKREMHPTLRQRLPGFALAALLGGLTCALVWFTDYAFGFSALIGGVGALAFVLQQQRAHRHAWAKLANAPAGDLIVARRRDLATRHKWNVAALVFMSVLVAVNLATNDLALPKAWLQSAALTIIIVIAFVQELRDRRELRELGA